MTNQPGLGGDPTAQGSQRAVFISYASEDTEDAQRICASLRAAGVEVWFDRNELRGGDAWDQSIRRQIRECALFIPVISSHTQARPEGYFRLEWRLADQRTHLMGRNRAFIVPVCVDGTGEGGADVPDSFAAAQWTRLPSGDASPEFCRRIAILLDGSGTVPPSTPNANSTPRLSIAPKPVVWVGLVVVIALVGAIVALAPDRWWGVSSRGAVTVPQHAATIADIPAPEKSIAVLPFDDMSEKHDQEYFSDGLAEELIDRLAQAPDLNVVSRTSSFYFKHRPTTIAEVAKALHIANVVEGSVRKSGQTLRITAQLIRAADGFHLWSSTYDRHLKDIFKVQDEIAGSIAQALRTTLAAPDAGQRRPRNPEAYNLLLQSTYYSRRFNKADYERAIEFAQAALKIDPTMADAWCRLAVVYMAQVAEGYVPMKAGNERARHAAEQALALDPRSPAAHANLVYLLMDVGDFQGARREIDLADSLSVNGQRRELNARGILEMNLGNPAEAIHVFQTGLAEDPLNSLYQINLAGAFWLDGRLADAEIGFRRTVDLAPQAETLHGNLALVLWAQHRFEPALAEANLEPAEDARLVAVAVIQAALGRDAESHEALEVLTRKYAATQPDVLADVYALLGDPDRAFEFLDRLIANDNAKIFSIKGEPELVSLHDDPRWPALLRRVGLPV